MGKGRLGAIVAATSLVLAGSALADGKTKLTGTVEDDALASVSLTVVKQGGGPKSIKNVRVRNLLTDCDEGEARIELNLSGAAKVDSKRKFDMTYSDGQSKVTLSGKVKADGSKVVGELSGSTVEIGDVGECDVPNAEFKVKK